MTFPPPPTKAEKKRKVKEDRAVVAAEEARGEGEEQEKGSDPLYISPPIPLREPQPWFPPPPSRSHSTASSSTLTSLSSRKSPPPKLNLHTPKPHPPPVPKPPVAGRFSEDIERRTSPPPPVLRKAVAIQVGRKVDATKSKRRTMMQKIGVDGWWDLGIVELYRRGTVKREDNHLTVKETSSRSKFSPR